MTTPGLLVSGLFVVLSALVVPPWRTRHRAGPHAGAVDALALLVLAAAGAATMSLALQVVSFGGHETAAQSGDYFSSLGSIFGVPVIAIPVGILVAVIGVAELLARNVRAAPAPSVPAANTVPFEHSSLDLRLRYANEVTDTASRERQFERRAAGGHRKAFDRFVRSDERTLNAIREDLATAASRSRAVLVESVAQIESRLSIDLEEHARVRASTHTAVEGLQETVTDCATDVSLALSGITDMCAAVADRIEAHRLERHALVDAIALLAEPVSTVRQARPAFVPSLEISVVDDERPPDAKPATLREERSRDYRDLGRGVLTSVQRLQERARSAHRKIRTRSRPHWVELNITVRRDPNHEPTPTRADLNAGSPH
ncbi:MAG: hypothetical protein ACLPVY_04725 [Acidimicrobiia bacterium]